MKNSVNKRLVLLIGIVAVMICVIALLVVNDKGTESIDDTKNKRVEDHSIEKGSAKQNHDHEWEPVKVTRTYVKVEDSKPIKVCSLCGENITSNVDEHIAKHEAKGEKCTVIDRSAKKKEKITKEVVDHYECSCGAKKGNSGTD